MLSPPTLSDNGNAPFLYSVYTPGMPGTCGTATRSLTINGASAATTIINGGNNQTGLIIDLMCFRGSDNRVSPGNNNVLLAAETPTTDDSTVTIQVQNITFQNGNATLTARDDQSSPDEPQEAGGFHIDTHQANVIVQNTVFNNNDGYEGGGLGVTTFDGNITLQNSTFTGNGEVSDNEKWGWRCSFGELYRRHHHDGKYLQSELHHRRIRWWFEDFYVCRDCDSDE